METYSLKKTLSYIDKAIEHLKIENKSDSLHLEKLEEMLKETKSYLLQDNISSDEEQMKINQLYKVFSDTSIPKLICLGSENDIFSDMEEVKEEWENPEE